MSQRSPHKKKVLPTFKDTSGPDRNISNKLMDDKPVNRKQFLKNLDERMKRLADKIHECHLDLVLDMQITLEGVALANGWANEIDVGFGRVQEAFEGVRRESANVARELSEGLADLSLAEVIRIMEHIELQSSRSQEWLEVHVINPYQAPEKLRPVEEFTIEEQGKAVKRLSEEQWLELMIGVVERGERMAYAEPVRDMDRKSFLAAYSELVRMEIDFVVKNVLEQVCGENYLREGRLFAEIIQGLKVEYGGKDRMGGTGAA